jgi:tetratricopeptide (TPR) repeat protein/DNA-binding CsgD family transcriptional regulator
MTSTIEELQQKLAETNDSIKKMDLMLDICRLKSQTRSDPTGVLKLAARARRLAATKKDAVRVLEAMIIQASARLDLGEYAAAMELCQQALALAGTSGEARTMLRIHHMTGLLHTLTGDYVPALECFHTSLVLAEQEQSRQSVGGVHHSMAIIYYRLGDLNRALDHAQQSRRLFEEIEDRTNQIGSLHNIAMIYHLLGDHHKAGEIYSECLAFAEEAGNKQLMMSSRINYGQVLSDMGHLEKAMECYEHALQISREIATTRQEGTILAHLGELLLKMGDFETALPLLQQSWAIGERIGDSLRWSSLVSLAKGHFEIQEYDQAITHALAACAGAEREGLREIEIDAHALLSKCYEAIDDAAHALRHHKLYTQAKEEVLGAEQQKKIAQMEMRTEIERAENEREIMRLEKQQLEQDILHKQKELAAMALHLVEKNQFLDSLKKEMSDVAQSLDATARPAVKGLMRQVDTNIGTEDDWKIFEQQFEAVHHGFITKLAQRYPKLTRTELKVCALLKIQMSTKEIANILATSTNNIEMQRYRIRKKLGLSAEQSFTIAFAEIQA